MTPTTKCPAVRALHLPLRVHPTAEKIEWVRWDGSTTMRSYEATCALCRDTVWEWGLVGGSYRIRRTRRLERGGFEVRLTPAVPRKRALVWWEGLLAGYAI